MTFFRILTTDQYHYPDFIYILLTLCLYALGLCPIIVQSAECPASWDDAGVSISNPKPAPPPGTPQLTIQGIKQFVDEHQLTNLQDLLSAMPPSMQKNYAFVETTRGNNLATIRHPRLIMFGSDARFLMAYGSHPDDPTREMLDMAQLDDSTGLWIFRSLDFSDSNPQISADDSNCVECHSQPPRPLWGTYPDWPGMFGPRDDRLTSAQSITLNRLRDTQQESDRFHHLMFLDDFYNQPGRPVSLPGRVYPYTNTVFNMELGAAVADGVYRRLQSNNLYSNLREELLVVGYCQREINNRRQVLEKVTQTLTQAGASINNVWDVKNELYQFLGVNPANAFSLHKLANEAPDAGWNVSTDSLYGLVELLVLNELMEDDQDIRAILANSPDRDNGFSRGCFDSLEDSLRYKIYQGWTLRTESRQLAREVDFDVDLLRSGQGIFQQAGRALCDALVNTVMNRTDITPVDNIPPAEDQPDNEDPVDNNPDDNNPLPDDNTPTTACPEGARLETNGTQVDYCWFENLPVQNGVQPYCHYLTTHQTLGYLFDAKLNLSCPSNARTATNGQGITFCLYENLPIPQGAQAQCDQLITQHRIGYSIPRQ